MSLLTTLILVTHAPTGGQLAPPVAKELVGAHSLALSPDGSQLAFSYRGDIWVAPSAGGRAIPVASHLEMDDYPTWSPDGKWIAFSSDRYGSWDIFAVPAEGGSPIRVTEMSGTEIPMSFSPDGKKIAMRGVFDKVTNGVYTIDINTGKFEEISIDNQRISEVIYSPDGSKFAYTRKAAFPYARPRYQGSGAAQIYETAPGQGTGKLIRNTGLQHLWLNYAPDSNSIYCVSATEVTPSSHNINEKPGVFADNVNRTPNVYSVDGRGKATRLTDYVGSGPRFLTVASKAGNIAFERDGSLYTMSPGGQPKKITITGFVDDKTTQEERLVLTNGVEWFSLSPDGKTFVFQVNRELWSVPVEQGKGPNKSDATQITDYAGSDENPLYAPDGKSVFFVSDREGARSLYRYTFADKKATKVVDSKYDIMGMTISPDKKSLNYWLGGPDGGLFTIPVEGGTPKLVLKTGFQQAYSWSPDGRYLAYARQLLNSGFNPWENKTNIYVLDTQTGKEQNVTRLSAYHTWPEWSKDGKYLYFISDRDGGNSLYALPLQKEDATGIALEIKYEKPKDAVKCDFDFNKPEDRIRRLYRGSVDALPLMDPEKGDIYFLGGGQVWRVGYDGEGARQLTNGGAVGGYEFSGDYNNIAYIQDGRLKITDIRKPNLPTQTVDFRAVWMHDLKAERKAAFDEFWRIYNLSFYDPYMHRRDWASIKKRYEPLLDGVGHRREMAGVLNLMVGELESSHSEVGPAPGGTFATPDAHPGFLVDYSWQGRGIKISEVPDGTPGSFEKTKLKAGEYVLQINGVDVTNGLSMYKALSGQTGREVEFTVNSSPTTDGARKVKYVAPSSGQVGGIINNNREKWRREYVEKKSGGKLTYVHIAGMGGGNMRQFNFEAWQYVQGKEGVIIDVRENGGGNISDALIDMLERSPQMRYLPRDDEEVLGPGTSWNKPTVVMHAESSFSNAEMFPAAMKARGLATLVGMPTPGYVIYTYGGRLVDGTSIRLPNTGVYRMDGTPTENMGQEPDFKVDITPEQYFGMMEEPQLDKAIEVLMKKIKK
ncbi:MAG: PD40 domain-containing protein [Armatimonadetes bacterium]|nr:PD40 domain-containing protein [Armatimonadota bacterium]